MNEPRSLVRKLLADHHPVDGLMLGEAPGMARHLLEVSPCPGSTGVPACAGLGTPRPAIARGPSLAAASDASFIRQARRRRAA